MKITLKEARNMLFTAAVPDVDSQQNIATFNSLINQACERLINSGSWKGCYEHVRFPIIAGQYFISLPPRYVSILAMAYEYWNNSNNNGTGCSVIPVQIRNEWLTVMGTGPFLWDWATWPNFGFVAWNSYSNDNGDGFCTFRDSPFLRYYLRFEIENSSDADKQVLVQGFDEDERVIYSPGAPNAYQGVLTTLVNPSVTTSQIFTRQLTAVQKPTLQGYLRLFAVDVDTGDEIQIGEYQPAETNPCYHRYRIGRCNNQNNLSFVRTILQRRYFPAVADTDEIYPANIGALKKAIAALKYEEQNDEGRYQINFNGALELLNNEMKTSRGGAALKMRVDGSAFQFQGLYPGR